MFQCWEFRGKLVRDSLDHSKQFGTRIISVAICYGSIHGMTGLICKKANNQLNALMRLSNYLSIDTKCIIYESFIRSTFSYCPLVWMFCGRARMEKLEKLQFRALRFVSNDFTSNYDDLLDSMNKNT